MSKKGKVIGMGKEQPQQPKLQIDPTKLDTVECESCGGCSFPIPITFPFLLIIYPFISINISNNIAIILISLSTTDVSLY